MSYNDDTLIGGSIVGLVVGGVAACVGVRYRVCKPNQFLVRTGLGIPKMSVSKKGVQWPFQRATFMDMNPNTYSFDLHNMSKEKVEFKLPVVFTIGPKDPTLDLEGFRRYAQTMNDMGHHDVHKTIQGVIEGEARGLTASLSIEEMFNAKDRFRLEVVNKIQEDLNKMGLEIYNANIKEMSDYDANNKYFEYRKQRAVQTANYEAQVEVSEARKRGEVGVKERDRDTRVALAKMDMEATVVENERKETVASSNAKLAQVEAEARLQREVANVTTDNEVKRRNEELLMEVERQRSQRELEKLRADELSKSKVDAEKVVVQATAEAEAIRTVASAKLFQQEQEAKGIQAILEAHSVGLSSVVSGAAGNPELVKFYLGLKDRLYQDIAAEQSKAFQGLKPKMSIWNTGSGDTANPISGLIKTFQSMAPLVDGLQEHTNLQVPFWNTTKAPKEIENK